MARLASALSFTAAFAPLAFPQSGTISTIAGGYPLGDGGPATAAALYHPRAIALHSTGSLYIMDISDARIRRVSPQGVISTIAGTGQPAGRMGDGPALRTPLDINSGLPDLAIGADGSVYFTENANHWVRRLTPDGVIKRFAGSGNVGFSGDGGPALAASFNNPGGLAMAADGSLFVSDTLNHRIRRIDPSGTVTTVAGTGVEGFAGDGGQAVMARISGPGALAVDSAGSLYVADRGNGRVRRIDRSGVIQTVAGGGSSAPADGLRATDASLGTPDSGIALGPGGDLFINAPSHVYRVSSGGTLSIVAPSAGMTGGQGLAADSRGYIYRADRNAQVLRIDPNDSIELVAGVGRLHGFNGPAPFALLNHPMTVAVDTAGSVYTVSSGLDQITPDGRIRVYASGRGPCTQPQPSATIAASTACLSPSELTSDPLGNLYAFSHPNRVHRITPDGLLTQLPGTGTLVSCPG